MAAEEDGHSIDDSVHIPPSGVVPIEQTEEPADGQHDLNNGGTTGRAPPPPEHVYNQPARTPPPPAVPDNLPAGRPLPLVTPKHLLARTPPPPAVAKDSSRQERKIPRPPTVAKVNPKLGQAKQKPDPSVNAVILDILKEHPVWQGFYVDEAAHKQVPCALQVEEVSQSNATLKAKFKQHDLEVQLGGMTK